MGAGEAITRKLLDDLVGEPTFDPSQFARRQCLHRTHHGIERNMLHVGRQHPHGTEHARQRRHHHASDPEIARQIQRMNAAVAARSYKSEIARVAPAFDGDGPDRPGHGGIRHRSDAVRRVLQRQAKGLGHMNENRALAEGAIDSKPATSKRARIDQS